MNPKTDVAASTEPLERVRSLIGETAAPEVVEVLQSFAQALLGRAPADFFRDRTDEQLVELVSTVFEHLDSTPWGEISVRVKMLPGAGHSGTVELMIDDRPFVVDTLRHYLTSKGFEIRHELHPVITAGSGEAPADSERQKYTPALSRSSRAAMRSLPLRDCRGDCRSKHVPTRDSLAPS